MAIDPQSIQLLSMIVDRQDRQNEFAARRGHDITMTKMQTAQRNLESQLVAQAEMFARDNERLFQLQNQLAESGVDVENFGVDSQAREMFEDREMNLSDRINAVSDLSNETANQLGTLLGAKSAIVRGVDFARGIEPVFDEDFNIDPESDLGRLRGAGNNDDIIKIAKQMGYSEFGDSAIEREAFARGVSGAVNDVTGLIQEESARMQAIATRNQIKAQRANEDLNRVNLMNATANLAQHYQNDFQDLMTPSILELTSEDADVEELLSERGDLHQQQADFFLRSLFDMSGIDVEDENYNTYASEIAKTFGENVITQEQALISNQSSFEGMIFDAYSELREAIKEEGSLENVLKNQAVNPKVLSTVFSFVTNPRMNVTVGGGFEKLDEIYKNVTAQRALKRKNTAVALDEIPNIYKDESLKSISQRYQGMMNERYFGMQEGQGGGGSDSEPSSSNIFQSIFGSESIERDDEGIAKAEEKIALNEELEVEDIEALMTDEEFMLDIATNQLGGPVTDAFYRAIVGYDSKGNKSEIGSLAGMLKSPFQVAGMGLSWLKDVVEEKSKKDRINAINEALKNR